MKNTCTKQLTNCILEIDPREMKMCVYQERCTWNVCTSSFICNSPKLETPKDFSKQIDKEILAHPHSAALPNQKEHISDTRYNEDGSPKYYGE